MAEPTVASEDTDQMGMLIRFYCLFEDTMEQSTLATTNRFHSKDLLEQADANADLSLHWVLTSLLALS